MATNNKRDFLGVPITLLSRRDAFEELLFWRAIGRCGYVTFVNPHSSLRCGRDVHECSAITQSHLTVPDGVGIAVAARLLGYGHIERLAGPSLMLDPCDWGRQYGLRHFFLGGGERGCRQSRRAPRAPLSRSADRRYVLSTVPQRHT